MEEKRKKFGMELLPSLHKLLKQSAIAKDVPLWRATQAAILSYLDSSHAADSQAPAPEHLCWHEKLDFVLDNGDVDDVTGIQRNLEWATNDIRTRKMKSRRKAG